MSATHDISRRFFADFIASRIKAWAREEGGSQPRGRAVAASDDGDPTRNETSLGDAAAIDEDRGLLPGLGSSGA
jgi:hypothetical protein